ncbi:MAG: B12-binding domain-containing radical SAM protein [Candidatus Dadabacteria bacterium]|nr:B12-binding domain-containing radical SAM protein [Candidatus Dadabacteria bacterium]
MKVSFINPTFPESLWSFTGVASLVGKRGAFAPLGLATIAACTPSEFEIEIQDEEIEPINFETDADIIALTAFNVQAKRAFEIAEEFRRRRKTVSMGGPYASLCPERCMPHVDVVLEGEGEIIWKEFLADYKKGRQKNLYKQEERISMRSSPSPRYDLLRVEDYFEFPVQATRGCPFTCEFCDIIITDGRVPRNKSVEQVLAEIEKLYELGVGSVVFTDANFIGSPKYTKELLIGLKRFGEEHGFPMSFACEATINLAEKQEILELMQTANFDRVFVGVESPRKTSLVETKKLVNTRGSLLENIRRIQSYGMIVVAGMIVGFDSDDKDIFQEEFDFLTEAGIPFTTVGTLVALENTPLYERLKKEDRLLDYVYEDFRGHGASDINFIPKQMTLEELRYGYNWLIRALYSYDNYSQRLLTLINNFSINGGRHGLTLNKPYTPGFLHTQNKPYLSPVLFKVIKNVLRYYLITKDTKRRRFFISSLIDTLKGGVSSQRFVGALSLLVLHKHFHDYVTKAHGDPETAGSYSPYRSTQ